MSPRTARVIVALALIAGLGGCAPGPHPSSSASPSASQVFSSEAEAFAAAEKTYRAYVDALNRRRLNDAGAPDPAHFLLGAALQADVDSQQQLEDNGLSIDGNTIVQSVSHAGRAEDLGKIELAVCLDSSSTRVLDRDGQDVTPQNRPDRTLVEVSLEWSDPEFFITDSISVEATTC